MIAFLGGLPIGPVMVPYAWIGFFLGLAVGIQFMKWHIRRTGVTRGDKVANLLASIVVAWLIGWKFSNVIVSPLDGIRHPVSLLSLPEEPNAGAIAMTVACLYGGYRYWRLRPPWRVVLDIWPFGLVAGGAMAVIFWPALGKSTGLPWGIHVYGGTFQPVNIYESIVLWMSLAAAWAIRTDEKGAWLLLFAGIGSLLVSLTSVHDSVFFGLSAGQWTALGMALVGRAGIRWRTRGSTA